MDENVLNDFISNFPPSINLVLETTESFQEYKKLIRTAYWEFVKRISDNCNIYTLKGVIPNHYLIGLKEKITEHKEEYLFEERESIIYSRFDDAIIIKPVQKGNLLSEACSYQYIYLQKAIDHLNEQLNVSSSLFVQKKEPLRKSYNREIHSRVNGFRIINQRNLFRTWEMLKSDEHKFISVTSNNFERNFTGKTIRQRIIWLESENCLHYFIDGIAGNHPDQGTGIEEEEAIWIKASQIFEKEGGLSFDSDSLSHANRKPTVKQIENLNDIITQFNKQPKRID